MGGIPFGKEHDRGEIIYIYIYIYTHMTIIVAQMFALIRREKISEVSSEVVSLRGLSLDCHP